MAQKANTPVQVSQGGTYYAQFSPIYRSENQGYVKLGYWSVSSGGTWNGNSFLFAFTSEFYVGAHYTNSIFSVVVHNGGSNYSINAVVKAFFLQQSAESLWYVLDTTNNRLYLYLYYSSGNSSGAQSMRCLSMSTAGNQTIPFTTEHEYVGTTRPTGAVQITT